LRIDRVICLLFALLAASLAASRDSAAANDMPPDLAGRLAGETLSAVVYTAAPSSAAGGLRRFAVQAYLRRDGRALTRVWDPARDAYTPTAERSWTVSGDRLCLDTPTPGPGRICANIHIWGPRIAGVGTGPYVLVDGDLRPGNMIFRMR
jgi:hypothetical protein